MPGPKTRTKLLTLATCVVFLMLSSCRDTSKERASGAGLKAIGLKTDRMQHYAAAQSSTNWCWAACIQMVLASHDIVTSQEQITYETFGKLVDRPGDSANIGRALNRPRVDQRGTRRSVVCKYGNGPLPLARLIAQLQNEVPVLVGYFPNGARVGHAVIITAVVIEDTPTGPKLIRVIVRDPWPDYARDQGKRIMTPSEFDTIQHYFEVQIQ